jgi:hypothetical protein
LGQELAGNGRHHARTVSRIRIGTTAAPVFQTAQGLEGLLHEGMTDLALDIGNKTNATGISFFNEPGLTKEGGRNGSRAIHGV